MTESTMMNAPWSAKGGHTSVALLKTLPSRYELLSRPPWSLQRATHEVLACGEKLTPWERKLVFLASRYPENFDATTGGFGLRWKAQGNTLPKQWERDLVLAALKYPFDLDDAESKLCYAQKNCDHAFQEDEDPDTFHFRDLKKLILSNAHAYYAHRFPKAERFDLITSSMTPTGRLDSVEFRCALIVYTDPKSKNWLMLYKSNSCPTVEDAAFKVKYWVEEDMSAVLDKLEAGDTWAAGAKDEREISKEGERKTGDINDTTDCSMSPGTVISNDSGDSNPGSTSNIDMPDLKRKARANNGGEERTKSVRTDNEGRFFVGRKKGAVPDRGTN